MCGRAYSTDSANELYFVYLNRKLQPGESPFENERDPARLNLPRVPIC